MLEDLAQAGKEDYSVELIALVLCLQSCLHWPHKDLPSLSRSISVTSAKSRASGNGDALLFLGLSLGLALALVFFHTGPQMAWACSSPASFLSS